MSDRVLKDPTVPFKKALPGFLPDGEGDFGVMKFK